jgi:enoyl-CoA hydratase/carnithine racemase
MPGVDVLRPEADICHLVLNDPARLNPLSEPLSRALQEALDAAMADPACRAIVLSGAGGNFSSGGDIDAMPDLTPARLRVELERLYALTRCIVTGEKPVIAAIEGHCAGAGNALAAASDIVIAARDAKFTCSFNRIGLMPDLGSLWLLPRRMGLGRAKLFSLTGERLDGRQAVEWGLADLAAEPGQAVRDALGWAVKMRRAAPQAVAMTKQMFAREPLTLEQALAFEKEAQAMLSGSADFAEGVAAFLEKRPARFKGS